MSDTLNVWILGGYLLDTHTTYLKICNVSLMRTSRREGVLRSLAALFYFDLSILKLVFFYLEVQYHIGYVWSWTCVNPINRPQDFSYGKN